MAGLSFLIYLAWELVYRGTYAYSTAHYPFDDADEWRYTACSRLVEHGYSLFSQVYSAQPPLFFLSLATSMRVVGDSIGGARAAEISYGALALLATCWIAWELGGGLAMSLSAPVLAISPSFLLYSHTVEAEGPMMALMTLSLALALRYRKTGALWILALSGLALAAAIDVKFFAVEGVLPVGWLLLTRRDPVPTRVTHGGVFAACAALPVAAEILVIAPRQQWQQVVSLHSEAARMSLPHLQSPAEIIWQFLTFDAGLTCLAVAGLIVAWLCGRPWETIFCALWLGGQVAMLLGFRPLFPHHPAILCTALAVCAGMCTTALPLDGKFRARLGPALVALAALAYIGALPRLVRNDRHTLVTMTPSNLTVLASYVAHSTRPGTMIAVDNVQVAERADRPVPPPLCDPSNVRFYAGQLTAQDLIAATRDYRAAMVIPLGNYNLAPSYIDWVHHYYRAVQVPGGGTVYRLR